MKKHLPILIVLLFLVCSFSKAQNIQWANEVIEFSSELTPVQYAAQQVLGKPNVLPAGGESPNAWTPDRANKKDFLKVGFAQPMKIRQIAIAESYNPSTIFRVAIFEENGTEHEVNTFNPRAIPLEGRMMNVFMEETPYAVVAVKVEFDGAAVPEYYSIDAIAISDSDIPITAEIALPEDLNEKIKTERLSENVNSKYKEFRPLLSPDGKILYFSRKNHPENIGGINDDEDIWYSEKDTLTGEWKVAKNIGPTLNNAGPNFVSSVTPDGKTVLMLLGNRYTNSGKMLAGVSISSHENGEWSKPTALEIQDDYNYSKKANFFLTNSRKALILSVERDDTNGDRDLYVSFLQEDSVWTEPLNLGKTVNTASEESSPFLAADDKTLYFSSKGFSGFGGSDIYVTQRLDDSWTNWSDPQNLGADINSEKEDLFFNIPASSDFAYYSKGVEEDDMDIFRIEMPLIVTPDPVFTIKGKLVNAKTNEPIEGKIVYERLSDGKEIGIAKSNPENGEYEIILPFGEKYGITATMDGFMTESQNIDLTDEAMDNKKSFELDNISLVPIEEKAVIVLNNVFFDFDKARLKETSNAELLRMSKLLKKNESIEMEVAGHTDNVGDANYNLQLSERRAKAVYNYLIKNGVKKDRLSLVYLGEKSPTTSNDTAEGRSQNRRVEFRIIKE